MDPMFLSSHYFHNCHPSLIIFFFFVLPSFINLNLMPPYLCPPSLCPPQLLCLCPPCCLTQGGGTCAPSWTAPCRMSVTCTCWWRRQRSRLFAEPSWKREGVTVHSLTCYSLWWWGTFSLYTEKINANSSDVSTLFALFDVRSQFNFLHPRFASRMWRLPCWERLHICRPLLMTSLCWLKTHTSYHQPVSR